MVLLHGAGRDGLSMLEMWLETGRKQGLLLVAPNGGSQRQTWVGRRAPTASDVAAAQGYGIDAQGMFLVGHSNGAGVAQTILSDAAPGMWLTAALHASYALPPSSR